MHQKLFLKILLHIRIFLQMEMFSNLITDHIDCIKTFSRSVVNSIKNQPSKIIIVFQLCHEIFGHYSSSVSSSGGGTGIVD